MSSQESYRLAVDIGGTFTDVAVADSSTSNQAMMRAVLDHLGLDAPDGAFGRLLSERAHR